MLCGLEHYINSLSINDTDPNLDQLQTLSVISPLKWEHCDDNNISYLQSYPKNLCNMFTSDTIACCEYSCIDNSFVAKIFIPDFTHREQFISSVNFGLFEMIYSNHKLPKNFRCNHPIAFEFYVDGIEIVVQVENADIQMKLFIFHVLQLFFTSKVLKN